MLIVGFDVPFCKVDANTSPETRRYAYYFLERGELLMDVPINRNDIVVILMAIQTLIQFWDYRNKKKGS